RHAGLGGRSVFVPEARTVHHDSSVDVRSYCRRVQWGGEYIVPFCQKHPNWHENSDRDRKNGYFHWKSDSLKDGARKLGKRVLGLKPITEILFAVTAVLARHAPASRALARAYSLLIGVHFFRGYRKGLERFGRVLPNQRPVEPTLGPDQASR